MKASAGGLTFNFPSSQQGRYQLSIYDPLGKVVYAYSGLGKNEIKINSLPGNGVYLAKFVQGTQSRALRFQVMN